jgi:hypothetical protein
MLVPTVAGGRVYVPSQVLNSNGTLVGGQVAVFGLRRPVSPVTAAPFARRAGAPIRLAGPVVFGPGSRLGGVRASSFERVVPAIPAARPAAHRFYGVLLSNEGGTMRFQTRSGRVVSVDARDALAKGFYSGDIGVGKACLVTADSVRGEAGLTAVGVFHVRRAYVDLPADR